jgi:hypothetical protein
MGLVNFFVGLALLTLGRRLFWLFVACVGFVAGITSVQQAWGAEPDLIALASQSERTGDERLGNPVRGGCILKASMGSYPEQVNSIIRFSRSTP